MTRTTFLYPAQVPVTMGQYVKVQALEGQPHISTHCSPIKYMKLSLKQGYPFYQTTVKALLQVYEYEGYSNLSMARKSLLYPPQAPMAIYSGKVQAFGDQSHISTHPCSITFKKLRIEDKNGHYNPTEDYQCQHMYRKGI